jgi:hypothetical protein
MKLFWVEGTFIPKKSLKKAGKDDSAPPYREPFAMSFWANSPQEALQEANAAIKGGMWVEGPVIAKKSEEERMRDSGAPQLPGFDVPARRKKSR